MPIRLTVGISKKLGLPRYSSVGATCQLEVELSHDLADGAKEGLCDHARRLYAACRDAVEEELYRHVVGDNGRPPGPEILNCAGEPPGNGRHDASGNRCSAEGQVRQTAELPATARQLERVRCLAGRIHGLDEAGLDKLSRQMHARPLAGLSRREASMLIGTLEEVRDGEVELEILLGRDSQGGP